MSTLCITGKLDCSGRRWTMAVNFAKKGNGKYVSLAKHVFRLSIKSHVGHSVL